jgi:crotonobetainyl-CoA:carnitine CoA-transferase CaiB-like acyl-CoA transferase
MPDMSTDKFASGPLDGIRVLELTQAVAGPAAGRILAELGAEVLKIEPLTGDPYRNTFNTIPDEGKRFQSLNLGKKSVAIDLQQEAGRELLQRLAKDTDVVLTNFRFGVPERLGFGYETLKEINPRIIYARITGFGVKSGAAARPASDPMMQSYSGLTVNGGKLNEDGLPVLAVNTIADYAGGMGTAIGILGALISRSSTGRGQIVDGSLLRGALVLQDTAVMREPVYDTVIRDPLVAEMREVQARDGSFAEINALRGNRNRGGFRPLAMLFGGPQEAKDGLMTLGALTPANRAAAARAFEITTEDEESIVDQQTPGHAERFSALEQRIKALVATRTVAAWVEILDREGCPVAPINIPELMSDDPLVIAGEHMVDLVHEVTGPQRVVGPLVDLSETPTRIQHAATPLGRYTRLVLMEAGVSDEEIERLIAAKVIREYVPAAP